MKTDESKTKRKRLMEQVETMEEKSRCLIDEIQDFFIQDEIQEVSCADDLAKEAETEKNFTLLTQSNAFRSSSSTKKQELELFNSSLSDLINDLDNQ